MRFWLVALLMGAATCSFADKPATPGKVTYSPSSLTSRTQAEVNNIANIIDALRTYAGRFGGSYPAKLEDLVTKNVLSEQDFKNMTTSPLDTTGGTQGVGYLYYPEGKDPTNPGSAVLILGKNPLAPSDSRRAVGMEDGSATWWKRHEVDTFLKAEEKKAKKK